MTAKTEPLTAKQLAIQLGTDARTVRKFLRSTRGLVGQGQRWHIEADKKSIAKVEKEFAAWQIKSRKPRVEDEENATPTPRAEAGDVEFDDLEEIEDLDLDDDD